MTPGLQRLALILVATIAAFGFAGYSAMALWTPGHHSPITDPDDFRAFYCAGRATLRGADPYLAEPLRTCEHAAAATFRLGFDPKNVIPAPLPPYALALFAMLGALPFPFASALWFALSIACLGIGAVTTARLSGLRPLGIALAFTTAGALVSTNEGQIAPFITAALCVAALAMRSGAMRVGGVGLGFAVLEPHVALGAVLAAFTERRMRLPIVTMVATLVVIDLVAGGPQRTLEYLTRVVPIHALTEIESLGQQFGLTTTLWAFGVPRRIALDFGTLDFFAMLVIGIATAIALRKRYDDPAFLILTPPAFVLLGGSYIHLFQMMIALPLAFVCFGKMRRFRAILLMAILCLAIPTQFVVLNSALRASFYTAPKIDEKLAPPWTAGPRDLAEYTQMSLNGAGHTARPNARAAWLATLPKIPTWLGLVALLAACAIDAASRGTKRALYRPAANRFKIRYRSESE